MQEDGSVVLRSDLCDSHPPRLTPNEAFALLDFLYERRDVLCRHAYRDKQEMDWDAFSAPRTRWSSAATALQRSKPTHMV